MQGWNTALAMKTEPFVRYTFMSGGERALATLTKEVVFDPLNPKVMEALEKHRIGSVGGINNETLKLLRTELATGMEAGESISTLRSRIESTFIKGEAYRAERIARTETIWAWNEGAVQGYKQSGMVEKKQWVSSGDERSCDFCPTLDGKIVGIDAVYFEKGGKFEVGESVLNFDYEDVGHPPLHANCRCAIVPIIEGI